MAKTFIYYNHIPAKIRCECCDKERTVSSYRVSSRDQSYVEAANTEAARYGYFHTSEKMCPACKKKRNIRIVLGVLLLAAVICTTSFGCELFEAGCTDDLRHWTYTQVLKRVESNPTYAPADDTDGIGIYTRGYLQDGILSHDYHMQYTGDTPFEVQKDTTGGKIAYLYKFGEGHGELSNRTFIHWDNTLYLPGDTPVAYLPTASEYTAYLTALQAYLPENYCMKDTFTQEYLVDDKDKSIVASVSYGDGVTAMAYMQYEGDYLDKFYYYEDADHGFLEIKFGNAGTLDAIADIPAYGDCDIRS